MHSTVGAQLTSLFAQACIAYYSLSSCIALFQSGICSLAGLRQQAVPATGWSYFLGLGLLGFVCPELLTSIFVTKLLMVAIATNTVLRLANEIWDMI